MQNTKVLNKKVDKGWNFIFKLGSNASGQAVCSLQKAQRHWDPHPAKRTPGVPLLAGLCSSSPVGLGVLLKGLSLLQQLRNAVKNMTWLLKTASFSY